MKRIIALILNIVALALCMGCLFSCGNNEQPEGEQPNGDKPGSGFSMIATVDDVGEKIKVNVIEAKYTSGVHLVITNSYTEFYGKDGKAIAKSDLKVGDTVEILYSGQVMMSLPPQIVAAKITVK